MNVYDGSGDIKALPTKHTVMVVSKNRIKSGSNDCMTIRKHGRADWSLFYCEQGCMDFDGQILNKGEIWIYPPNTPQRYVLFAKNNTVYHYLHFMGSDVEEMLSMLGISFQKPIRARDSLVLKTLSSIQTAMEDDSVLSKLKAEYHTLHLISQIATGEKQASKSGIIKRAMDEMEHSFTEKYDASHYAEMLNLSQSRFNHLFKEETGQSPYNFFIGLRIDNASTLLEATDLKIKDIAQKCGFEDPLYFAQAFKRIHGITPSEYRKLNRI
jgi:AraC-like DNA-binding protein